jgi:predicted GIY-YIG superfamily endonuclease
VVKQTQNGTIIERVVTRPERDLQQMTQCVYSIPCECGRTYVGRTGRPLAMWLCEHRYNSKEGLLGKSKVGQLVYLEGHRVMWYEARNMKIEGNSRPLKYKKSTHMLCLTNAIRKPSLNISTIWTPLIINRVTQSKGSPWHHRFPIALYI